VGEEGKKKKEKENGEKGEMNSMGAQAISFGALHCWPTGIDAINGIT